MQAKTDLYEGSWVDDVRRLGAENYYPDPGFVFDQQDSWHLRQAAMMRGTALSSSASRTCCSSASFEFPSL